MIDRRLPDKDHLITRLCNLFENRRASLSDSYWRETGAKKGDFRLQTAMIGSLELRADTKKSNSIPNAGPCQGWGRGFESPRPLQHHQSLSRFSHAPPILRGRNGGVTCSADVHAGHARKLRHAAEREATGENHDAARRETDTKAAEARRELTDPEHGIAKPGSRKQE